MQKQNYLIAALDMDGTLLNSQHMTTAYTRDVIRRAGKAGKLIALATGRCMCELTEHMEEIGADAVHYVISENGACVYDVREKKSLCVIPLERKVIDHIMEAAMHYEAIVQFYIDNQTYLRVSEETSLVPYKLESFKPVFKSSSIFQPDMFEAYRAKPQTISKVNVYFTSPEDRQAFRREIGDEALVVVDSIGIGIEISANGVHKGRGLEMLCEQLSVPAEQVLAIGDGCNDLEILEAAGLAVAMGNAIPEVLALADVVTEDNDHDGAAKAIEKYLL